MTVETRAGMLDWVDRARGLAILLIIVVHSAQRFSLADPALRWLTEYAQMGVQLFFVASAFTLCHARARRRDESRPLLSFYVRRIFRIAPLYQFAVVFYALGYVANQWGRADWSWGPYAWPAVLANLLLVHGLVPSANNQIVPGGWSIGTEMLFYAVFPLLAAALLPVAGGIRRALLTPVLALALVLLAEAVSGQWADNNSFFYFSLLNQLPVFLLGMSYFQLLQQGRWPRLPAAGMLAAALVLLVPAAWLWHSGWPAAFTLLPFVSGLSFVCVMDWLRQGGGFRWLAAIGRVSFSMYVFHFVFAWRVAPVLTDRAGLSGVAGWLCALAITVVMTWLAARVSERLIERPGIRLGSRLLT